jgi:hypothetical protein
MVKRHGNLFERVVAYDNLLSAFTKAVRGKRTKSAVRRFSLDIEGNLLEIQRLLKAGEFSTGTYNYKRIFEPKERLISILPFSPDRIVHHAIMNIVEPIWKGLFISESHACIKGRGLHLGSRHTMDFVRRNEFVLKCDISKFYPSIRHDKLKSIVRRKIKDPPLLRILDDIIDSSGEEVGVPIGNYCSQWLGNLYLNELDSFVKSSLHVKDYIRYCDDFCLFAKDKPTLRRWAREIEGFIGSQLGLRFSKSSIFPLSQGVDFLGYRHFKDFVLLRKATTRRIKKRLWRLPHLLRRGVVSHLQFVSSVASIDGWLMWACSGRLRKAIGIEEVQKAAKKSLAIMRTQL